MASVIIIYPLLYIHYVSFYVYYYVCIIILHCLIIHESLLLTAWFVIKLINDYELSITILFVYRYNRYKMKFFISVHGYIRTWLYPYMVITVWTLKG